MHVFLLVVALIPALVGASPPPEPAPELTWELVSRRPHDGDAFTQGLELDDGGRLYESTGISGESTLREVDPASGEVLRSYALPDEHFGEGITTVGDRIIGLTYQAGTATSYDLETFEPLETFTYEAQGWGLCHDGTRLVMSNGGPDLTFRDPETFEAIGAVTVTLDGEPLYRLNELECVRDEVWANVWKHDRIYRIDPGSGAVTGYLDLADAIEPWPPSIETSAVLNGIAWNPETGTYLVTGMRWPELLEIRVLESRTW